jgi:predicted KAP-like P-loop ATPase
MLFRRLDAILAATPEPLFEKNRWRMLFSESLGRMPRTPRDVVRFTNALALTYGPVREEVNAVDFIAIEAIRVFLPEVYDVIRRNPEMFCELSWRSIAAPSAEDLKKFHDGWFAALSADGSIEEEYREPLQRMLCLLFLRVDKIWSHPPFSSSSNQNNALKRFIRDPDTFPVYFALAVPETSISRAEVIALLSWREDALIESLVARSHEKRRDGISRARAILEVLRDFVQDLPPNQSAIFSKVLLRAGDDLLSAERFQGNFFPSQAWLFAYALKAALRNIPVKDRAAALSSAIQESMAIGALAWTVEVLGSEHGKYGAKDNRERDPLVTEEEVSQLEQEAIGKIRDAAQSGALLSAATLPNTLINWQRWAGNGEVRDWILTVVQNPRMLAQMLESYLSEANINGSVVLRIDPEWFRKFVDPALVRDAAQKLVDESWLQENQKIAVDKFIRAYEAREKGQDSDPF